jgi:hypothetical protein
MLILTILIRLKIKKEIILIFKMQEERLLTQKAHNKNRKRNQILRMKNKINLSSLWNNIYKNLKKKHFKSYLKINSKF